MEGFPIPLKSKSQQRFMFAAEARGDLPKGTARTWAHHTPDIKKLPEHVRKKASITEDTMSVEKMASDMKLSPALIVKMAAFMKVPPDTFVAEAYRDPQGFRAWFDGLKKQASDRVARGRRKTASLISAIGNSDHGKNADVKQAALQAVREIATKRIHTEKRAEATTIVNCFLDVVAANMPMTKQASVRTLQAALAQGKPLLQAIKIAHPHITPEQRGAFAVSLVKAAVSDFKKRMKTSSSTSVVGKPGSESVTGLMYGKKKEASQSFPDAGSMNKAAAGIAPGAGTSGIGSRILGGLKNMFSSSGQIKNRAMDSARDVGAFVSTGVNAGKLVSPAKSALGQAKQQIGDRDMARLGVGAGAGGLGLGAIGTGAMSGNGNKEQMSQLQQQLQQQQAQTAEYENALRQLYSQQQQRRPGFRRNSA